MYQHYHKSLTRKINYPRQVVWISIGFQTAVKVMVFILAIILGYLFIGKKPYPTDKQIISQIYNNKEVTFTGTEGYYRKSELACLLAILKMGKVFIPEFCLKPITNIHHDKVYLSKWTTLTDNPLCI